jgi:hypothetical protein
MYNKIEPGKGALVLNCMKCGREIALGQVFCKECLADMANYPIKPGTPVQLPTHINSTQPRRERPVRKPKKPEEQISILKKYVIGLSVALLAVTLAFSIATTILTNKLEDAQNNSTPGQNYSTVDDIK